MTVLECNVHQIEEGAVRNCLKMSAMGVAPHSQPGIRA